VRACIGKNRLPECYDASCANLARKGCYVLALAFKELSVGVSLKDVCAWDRSIAECDLTLAGVLTFDNLVKVLS
jgi:cation-transporting ATPase 13A3/4/5